MTRVLFALSISAVLLAGCGNTGIICTTSEVQCGETCANLTLDPDNCGNCGLSCGTGFACVNSTCVCPTNHGLQLTACGQTCVSLQNSGANCGACGQACPSGEFCNDGGCGQACPSGFSICGGGCVDTTSDRQNCGGCGGDGGVICGQGQACLNGVCGSDLYASCFNSGQIWALDAEDGEVAPIPASAPLVSPAGMAFHDPATLAVVDGVANELDIFNVISGFDAGPPFAVGAGPNAIVFSGDVAAVTNSQDNSLDVLQYLSPGWSRRCPSDAGGCVASVHFAPNSSPEYAAFDSQAIYVSLLGQTDNPAPSGNQLARVSLADLSVQLTDLSGFDLQAPDAGTSARPYGVAVANGQVFVALANLAGFNAVGPGLVAVLDVVPDGGAPVAHGFGDGGIQQPIALGSGCFNAGAVLLSESTLYVACGPQYDPVTFAAVVPGAVAALDITSLQPAFAPQPLIDCQADGGNCVLAGASQIALAQGKLFIGDSTNGRLFVADPTTGLVAPGAIDICLAQSGGFNLISDVVARP